MRGLIGVMALVPSAAFAEEPRKLAVTFSAGVQSAIVDRAGHDDDPHVDGVLDAELSYQSSESVSFGGFVGIWSYRTEGFDDFTGEFRDTREVMLDFGARVAFSFEGFAAGPGIAYERDVTGFPVDFFQLHAHASYTIDRCVLSTQFGWSYNDDDDIVFGRLLIGVRL